MRDTISEEDLLNNITKTEIEKKLEKSEKEKEIMKDEIEVLREEMQKIYELVKIADAKANVALN
jgi:hypothetical protein